MTNDELGAHRSSIDKVDAALVRLLAERFRITHEIGVYKANNDLPPVDLARQRQQSDELRRLAVSEGLDPDFCERFLHFVREEVVRNHRRLAEAADERKAHSTDEPT